MMKQMVLALYLAAAGVAPASAETANQRAAAHVFLVKMGKVISAAWIASTVRASSFIPRQEILARGG